MKFYRYDMSFHGSIDEFGDPIRSTFPSVSVTIHAYNLHKETPKGYWIGYGHDAPDRFKGNSRWVSKTGKKRYAYPTKEEALTSFIKRQESKIRILEYQISGAKQALSKANVIENKRTIPTIPPEDREKLKEGT